MKKILLLLLSILTILILFNSYGLFDKTVCVETDTQISNDLYHLPNTTKPFSGKDLCKNEKGQILSEGKVKKGKLVSQTFYYYWDNGQKKYEKNYEDGKEGGEWTGWYKNGQKEYVWNYKDGKFDGKSTTWRVNGLIESESTYKDNKCISGDCDYY